MTYEDGTINLKNASYETVGPALPDRPPFRSAPSPKKLDSIYEAAPDKGKLRFLGTVLFLVYIFSGATGIAVIGGECVRGKGVPGFLFRGGKLLLFAFIDVWGSDSPL